MAISVLRWIFCAAIFGLLLYPLTVLTESSKNEAKAVRTDVIDKSVLALKTVFLRTFQDCDPSCREERNAKLKNFELEDRAISEEAIKVVRKIMAARNIDLDKVNSWIDHAGKIQKNYFNSVFQYHRSGSAIKDALFYLDIGEPHKAADELLANQRALTQIGADCSTIFEVGQAGRSGIAFRLLNQLTDLNPYHTTFGCMQSTIQNADDHLSCAIVMRRTFEISFMQLQEVLTKFFTTELTEDDVLQNQF